MIITAGRVLYLSMHLTYTPGLFICLFVFPFLQRVVLEVLLTEISQVGPPYLGVVSVSEDARYTLFLAYDITPLAGNTALVVCYRFCTSAKTKRR